MNKTNKTNKRNIVVVYDDAISSPEITLVDKEKKLIGKFSLKHARELAMQEKKNLIEISSNDKNTICIIEDLNKYKYETNKKSKKIVPRKTKEIRITSKSDLTDLLRNMEQCYQFILEKNLSVIIMLRSYKKSFWGKEEFIKNHIDSQDKITYSIQKSPRPNIMKLYVTRKSNKS